MKSFKLIVCVFILMLVSLSANAQRLFDTTHELFSKNFTKTFRDVKYTDRNGKKLAEEFENCWFSDTLSFEDKDKFIEIANLLSEKGALGFPHYYLLADNFLLFKRSDFENDKYDDWQAGLVELLSTKRRLNKKIISNYQEIANHLLRDSIIAVSPRVTWKVSQFPIDLGYKNGQPFMKFSNTDILATHSADSIIIKGTSGTVYPLDKKWVGQYGRVTWERVNLSPDSVYADLNKYNINLEKTAFSADSATFVNLNYFDKPLLGKIEDKAGNLDNTTRSTYPRFETYTKKFDLSGVLDGIDYSGGFSMKGERFMGTGFKDEKAKISIVKNDSVKLVAKSEAFVINPEKIFSENAEIIIHLSKDSIYHPNLLLKYTIKDKVLDLQRRGEGMSNVYFSNSYHNLHMEFTWLQWNIEKYKIQFGMLKSMSGVNEAYFESSDYFSEKRYQQIQLQDEIHPFVRLEDFVAYYGSPEFPLTDFALYIGYAPDQVKRYLLRLAYAGFILYDTSTDFVKIKPEVYKYLDAMRRVVDYDVIEFPSKTSGSNPNASLSLLNYDLEIYGVPGFQLSDSQVVAVYPADEKIIMKKNRDFVFNGLLRASQFFYYGHDFHFKYDDFMVEMEHCDSMKMLVETGDIAPDGALVLKQVDGMLENINGEYYIDDPENKSGRHDMPQFPQFVSKNESYVYYDQPKIFNKVYDRNKFFFKIQPFELDSLSGYARKNLVFDGTLYSADIFPDINETLVVRPDYSLGFHQVTAGDGLPCYQGKGTYTRHIDLSNQGLRGAGRIDYINTEAYADSVIFFPDSCLAHAGKVQMKATSSPVDYPSVNGVDNSIAWYPYMDEFNVTTLSDEFVMFDEKSTMKGTLTLTPEELKGAGKMKIDRSELVSNTFSYKQDIINADTSDFKLFNKTRLSIDFSMVNVNTHIDFTKRLGHFIGNGNSSYIDLPENQYTCLMNEIEWYMDDERIDIRSDKETLAKLNRQKNMTDEEWEDLFEQGPKFVSTHPEQDSLGFFASFVKYDLKDYIISAEGVRFIRVADAIVYTDDGKVTVEKNAVMKPLEKTEIIANVTDRYHKLKDAKVNITGKKSYTGEADYDYKDKAGRIQNIHFDEISVDFNGQTIAKAYIEDSLNFNLSPNFDFRGNVKLFAKSEHLTFDGGVKMKHICPKFEKSWLKFRTEINPAEIAIPVDSFPVDIVGKPLAAGLLVYRDSAYAAMFSPKTRRTDKSLFLADGFLVFDEKSSSYKVSNKEKLEDESLPGNLIAFNRHDCTMSGSGRFNFSDEFGLFKPNPIGNFSYDSEKDSIHLNLTMLLDFHFNKKALKILAEDINNAAGLTAADLSSEIYEQAMFEYLGREQAEKWFAEMGMGNYKKQPKALTDLFIVNDVNMTFYKEASAYIHEGPVGIVSIGEQAINQNVFSFISIEKNRRGDSFNMYLELDSQTWYYFRFAAGNMAAISSNNLFNELVYDSKPNERLIEAKGKMPSYRYSLGSNTYLRRFLKNMNELFGYDENHEDNEDYEDDED